MMKFKHKSKSGKGINAAQSRKELRKQQRKEKKAKKHAFFQKNKNSDKVSDVASVRNRGSQNASTVKEKTAMQYTERQEAMKKVSVVEQQQIARNRKKQQEDRRKQQYQKRRTQQLKAANEEEDKVIKKLAKQLKLNKRKQKTVPKSFSADGLDYLLELCDEEGRQNAVSAEKYFLENSDSEFEEDLALVTGRVAKKTKLNSLSETGDAIQAAVNSDHSVGSSDIEDDSDEEQDIPSSSEDLENDTDNGECLNSDVLVSNHKHNKNDRHLDRLDRQRYSDDDFTNPVHVSQNPEKGKTNKVVKIRVKEVEGGKMFKTVDDTKSKASEATSELSDSDAAVVNQKIIRKRKLVTCGDSDEEDDRGIIKQKKKKESKIAGCDGNTRKNSTLTSASKEMGVKKKSVTFEDDELSGLSEDFEDEEVKCDSGEDVWEDIYGRIRDRKGNILHAETQGKYIPPHLRVKAGDEGAKKQVQLLRLRKQIKGLLNRLAESNMNNIAVQLDELYMSNSRNNMNETLTQLVLESLITPVLTPERLVMEQVMLIAILHANVGSEVGAHFMQVIVKKFELLNSQCHEVEHKELDNVVLTLSHLYNFRVFHCILVFDILEKLVEKFGEKEIELILIVLRSVGFSLRKDDPSALKDFIVRVQHKASANAHCNSSRVNFMLDILLAIKNNNMSKIPNYDTSHSEHLKKLLKGFLRKGNYVTELKISLDDLLKAEERGRWWVVGSAWTAILPGEVEPEEPTKASATTRPATQYSEQLLELARKQRMNTDVRRNIFCILMTAEDYLDAFEKLLHLGLKNQQEREIIYVILHCCLQEKEFNPYYGFLAQKLCDFDRRHQMTLQFTLWDRFKEMQSFNQQQTTNLAKLLTHLLLERGIPISVLKVVEFMNVDKRMVRFLRQTLLGVLLSPCEDASLQVFQRVAQSAKLRMFCERLRLFVHHFLLRNTTVLPEADAELLTRRAKLADTLLTASKHKSGLYDAL